MITISKVEIPKRSLEESITDLLESIALEEASLAHYINAEAEKIQAINKSIDKGKICFEDTLKLQKSITKAMRMPIKKQILLQFKLEDIIDFKSTLDYN